MRPSSRSLSYCPQTRVNLLVKSLALVFMSFLGFYTKSVSSSVVQNQPYTEEHLHCDFSSPSKLYDIQDLLECMEQLASGSILNRKTRQADNSVHFFPQDDFPVQQNDYRPYQQSQHSNYRPSYHQQTPSQSINYVRPSRPALPPGYHQSSDSNFPPGIFGINLLGALSSISQYDDRKCVPRIICEVATGVIPGSTRNKQNYVSSSMNSLISLLTAVDFGASSPLINFGKSALMGYSSRGNPEICYQQYPQCPRNPNQVVDYLNNHNGGFFRFFNTQNTGSHYRDQSTQPEAQIQLENSNFNRKATEELKFDPTTSSSRSQILINDDITGLTIKKNNQIIFPDDQRLINRFVKSANYREDVKIDDSVDKTKFFHKNVFERNESPDLNSHDSNAKLYFSSHMPGESVKSFIFPDGQRVMIDTAFTKLFSPSYKKMLKRGLMSDAPQPIDLEGLNVINLAELWPEDEFEQVIHPCDMICHDSRGTAVQFSQTVSSGSLSTLMTPDRPILDLSDALPCEVACLQPRGERKLVSTTLDKVLRPQQAKNQGVKLKIIKPRFVGDAGNIKYEESNIPSAYDLQSSIKSVPLNLAGGLASAYEATQPLHQKTPYKKKLIEADSVPIGENPLAIAVEPQDESDQVTFEENYAPRPTGLPAAMSMCSGCLYFLPPGYTVPTACARPVPPADAVPVLSPEMSVIFKSTNPWKNYSDFFAQFSQTTKAPEASPNLVVTLIPLAEAQNVPTPPTRPKSGEENAPVESVDLGAVPPVRRCPEGFAWDPEDIECLPVKYPPEMDDTEINRPTESTKIINRDVRHKIFIGTPEADMIIES